MSVTSKTISVSSQVSALPPKWVRQRGPIPAWLGRIAEPLYRWGLSRRNRRFEAGEGVHKLKVPVVSIGNLSVGGTGKTPMVMHVLRLLYESGRKPCVAMRGYGPRPKVKASSLLIDQVRQDRQRIFHPSDEADEYARMFEGLPIVARPDRIVGLQELLEKPFQPTVDCVVLDDGFQHRQIARNFDVVLIDASRPPMHDHLLPRGWLREPPESLRRASCVVITHAELCAADPSGTGIDAADTCESFLDLAGFITHYHGRPPIAVCSHVWTALRRARSHALDDDDLLPLDDLLGRRVIGVCAIGNPRGFLTALNRTLRTDRSNPGTLCQHIVLPDHDPFDSAVVRMIAKAASDHEADAIIVTQKDWSKLRRYPANYWPCPILRPELSLVFNTGQAAFERELLEAVGAER